MTKKELKEFIEKVENQDYWDDTNVEDYEKALEEVGLNYYDYNDPDIMWDEFLEAVKKNDRLN